MRNILLKDNKNGLFQEMMFLRDDTELLICENINKINRKDESKYLNIETISDGISEYWEKQGYKRDMGLYNRLILEHINKHNELLEMWR